MMQRLMTVTLIPVDTHSQSDDNVDAFKSLLDGMKVENSYRGVHLIFPLTLNQLHKMVQAFRRKQVRFFIMLTHP